MVFGISRTKKIGQPSFAEQNRDNKTKISKHKRTILLTGMHHQIEHNHAPFYQKINLMK